MGNGAMTVWALQQRQELVVDVAKGEVTLAAFLMRSGQPDQLMNFVWPHEGVLFGGPDAEQAARMASAAVDAARSWLAGPQVDRDERYAARIELAYDTDALALDGYTDQAGVVLAEWSDWKASDLRRFVMSALVEADEEARDLHRALNDGLAQAGVTPAQREQLLHWLVDEGYVRADAGENGMGRFSAFRLRSLSDKGRRWAGANPHTDTPEIADQQPLIPSGWDDIAVPALERIALDEPERLSSPELARLLNLTHEDLWPHLASLEEEGYISMVDVSSVAGPESVDIALLAAGRREVGSWPSVPRREEATGRAKAQNERGRTCVISTELSRLGIDPATLAAAVTTEQPSIRAVVSPDINPVLNDGAIHVWVKGRMLQVSNAHGQTIQPSVLRTGPGSEAVTANQVVRMIEELDAGVGNADQGAGDTDSLDADYAYHFATALEGAPASIRLAGGNEWIRLGAVGQFGDRLLNLLNTLDDAGSVSGGGTHQMTVRSDMFEVSIEQLGWLGPINLTFADGSVASYGGLPTEASADEFTSEGNGDSQALVSPRPVKSASDATMIPLSELKLERDDDPVFDGVLAASLEELLRLARQRIDQGVWDDDLAQRTAVEQRVRFLSDFQRFPAAGNILFAEPMSAQLALDVLDQTDPDEGGMVEKAKRAAQALAKNNGSDEDNERAVAAAAYLDPILEVAAGMESPPSHLSDISSAADANDVTRTQMALGWIQRKEDKVQDAVHAAVDAAWPAIPISLGVGGAVGQVLGTTAAGGVVGIVFGVLLAILLHRRVKRVTRVVLPIPSQENQEPA